MSEREGYLRIVAAAVLWGSLGVAGRVAFRNGVLPLEAAFLRAGIAFVAILAAVLATDPGLLRVRRQDLPLFGAFGLVSIAAFFFVYLYAISRTTVATAAILLYTAPAFVILLSALFFHEPLTRTKLAAVVLAFAGCILVVRGYDPLSLRLNLPGVLAGLASGFTYAMYSIFGKTALRRYSPMTTLTYALGFGTVILGAAAVGTGTVRITHSPAAWSSVVYLALVTTLVAQWLYLAGLVPLEAGRASLVATLEPVVAAALGYALLGEGLEGLQLLGGMLVLSAVLLVRSSPPAAPRPGAGSSPD
ncbi:MAG: EamA family transporter [Armatimonadota bacterium]|nr:EamA family transporter [Armatimonadota bacterium]MDR7465717.1 EamA family transporter [Armatimonadota bacterium]MDR7493625.1 EamA family transporter [Armatimonadota bacterium]MDR7499126.1 EamA family transporter [Armatimonadota bacterium]MDR7503431.1 EamA family transporter [Armatimonadota bacterium]